MPHAGAVGKLRRPRRRRPDRHAGAGSGAAAGGRDGAAETTGPAGPRPADVCGPGLLARRRFALPGRLAGHGATGTGAFAVAGRRLRGGAGRRRPLAPAVKRNLLHFYGWRKFDGALTPCAIYADYRRTSRTLRRARRRRNRNHRLNWRSAWSLPEPDSYVSGMTKLKAEILPKMLAHARRADPVLRRRQAGVQRARPDRGGVRVGCRRRSAAARLPRRRQPDRRRPHRRQLAHQGPRSGREGVGRRRAGHRGRDRSRPIRLRPAAIARSSCSKTACRRPSATSPPKARRSRSWSRSTSAKA